MKKNRVDLQETVFRGKKGIPAPLAGVDRTRCGLPALGRGSPQTVAA